MKALLWIIVVGAITAVSAFGAGSGSAGSAEQPTTTEQSPAGKPAAKKEKSSAVSPVVKEKSPAVSAYNEGVALMQKKQFAEAQPKFEQAIKLDPDFAEAYNNLAFVLRKQGSPNFPKSLAYYNKAIELKPKLAEAYMYRGVLYTQMGRKGDAQADLTTLKKLDRQLAKELEEVHANG